jgi:hypothetical protein
MVLLFFAARFFAEAFGLDTYSELETCKLETDSKIPQPPLRISLFVIATAERY